MNTLDSFRELGISDAILKALDEKGFTEPSPIQKLTIPLLLSGEKDMIGQAQTGTGKTAAFGIPVIQTLSAEKRSGRQPRALILTPTRELCIQVAEELNSMEGTSDLRIAPFYGGQYIGIQLGMLRDGIDVVVGTPGRVIDLIERGRLTLEKIEFAILDEADEMLDMGFIDDIAKILEQTPSGKRMLLFSATMPEPIRKIAEQFMRPGYEIIRTARAQCDTLTKQIYYELRRENKLDALVRIIDMDPEMYAMVFCRTRTDVDELTEALTERGIPADCLHGDIAQAQRTRVINNFKARKFKILIATDVAARGIDVNDLTHVINYSIPESAEPYIHRIGRTGRAGKTGTAITFVTPAERRKLAMIRRAVPGEIEKGTIPGGGEAASAMRQRVAEMLGKLSMETPDPEYTAFASELMAMAHPATLIATLLKLKFRDTLSAASYSDIAAAPVRRDRRDSGMDAEEGKDRSRAVIEIAGGKDDGLTVPGLLELIHARTGIRGCNLGHIDMGGDHTVIAASAKTAEAIVNAFNEDGEFEAAWHEDNSPEPEDRHGGRPFHRGRSFRRDYDRDDRDDRNNRDGRYPRINSNRSYRDSYKSERGEKPFRKNEASFHRKKALD